MTSMVVDHAIRAAAPRGSGGLQRSLGLHAVLAAVLPEPPPERRIGRFAVEARLGFGSMGTVYRARDLKLGRTVAIKITRDDRQGQGRARAWHEARALVRAAHRNVVTVFEVSEHEAEACLVMEYVDGTTLDEWVTRTAPSCRARLTACLDAGRGLAAAHAAGVIHCDFKPHNVLVGMRGQVRLADFGVARVAEVESPAGAGGHTPRYAAPEVLAGAAADPQSDQYSYCRTLLELTAHCPFFPMIRPLLERGCAEQPADRWPSVNALLEAIRVTIAS